MLGLFQQAIMKPHIKAILPLFLSSLALLGCSSPAPTASSVASSNGKETSSTSSILPSSDEESSSISSVPSSSVDYGIVDEDPKGEITYEQFKAKTPSSMERPYTNGAIYLKVEDKDGTNQYACPLLRLEQEYRFLGTDLPPVTVEEWRIDWDHCDKALSNKIGHLDNCFIFWDLVNAITLYDNSPYNTLTHFYETPLGFTFHNGGGGGSSQGGSYSFTSDQTILYGEDHYPAAAKTVYKKTQNGDTTTMVVKGILSFS